MGGRAEGLACADPGARTPSALAEIFKYISLQSVVVSHVGLQLHFPVKLAMITTFFMLNKATVVKDMLNRATFVRFSIKHNNSYYIFVLSIATDNTC